MEIVRWEPLEAVDSFFSDHPLKLPKLGWDLAIDLFEEGKNVVAKMSLPGIIADDLEISVEEDSLTISGMREEEEEVDEKEYYSKEIRRGSFSRTVDLPKRVDPSKAKAEYEDGVLKVTIPSVGEKAGKSVQVKVAKK
jgi:HSP20 family protein